MGLHGAVRVNKQGVNYIMDESDYRKTLTQAELESRAFIIPFKVYDFAMLERLNKFSTEYAKTLDELINRAIVKFMDDIEVIQSLKL